MITIVANYRTGSNTLVKSLSKITGLRYSEITGEYCHPLLGGYRLPSEEYGIYKIMPTHILDSIENFKKDFLEKSQNIFYSVRKDFDEECFSFSKAKISGVWHNDQILKNDLNFKIGLNIENLEIAKQHLLKNLEVQSLLYRQYPGTLCWLEDREQDKYIDIVDCNMELNWTSNIDPATYFT